jgi:hypothetical protein
MVLDGSDVEALYPSLKSERVAQLVYRAIMRSEVKFGSIDFVEAVRYIAMAWSLECSGLQTEQSEVNTANQEIQDWQ